MPRKFSLYVHCSSVWSLTRDTYLLRGHCVWSSPFVVQNGPSTGVCGEVGQEGYKGGPEANDIFCPFKVSSFFFHLWKLQVLALCRGYHKRQKKRCSGFKVRKYRTSTERAGDWEMSALVLLSSF